MTAREWSQPFEWAVHYQAATAAGLSLNDAAPLTWTGLRASEYGYDKVAVTLARGSSGNYDTIRVEFSR